MTFKKHKQEQSIATPEYLMLESIFHIEIRQMTNNRKAITIAGVEKIATYSENLMLFQCTKNIRVAIKGEMLQCQTYVNRMILVVGEIQDISFGGGER